MKKYILVFFLGIFFISSCKFTDIVVMKTKKFIGFKVGTYDNSNGRFGLIKTNMPPIYMPLKVEDYGDFTLIQEYGTGIHILQTKGQITPVQKAFFDMPASSDFSIQNDVLVINSGKKLQFFNLKNLKAYIDNNVDIGFIKTEDVQILYPNYPPFKNFPFECPDSTRGYVTQWKLDSLTKITCFR